MSQTDSVLTTLAEISSLDGKIASVNAERKKIEQDLEKKRKTIKEYNSSLEKAGVVLEERRKAYNKEEKRIKEERDKLVSRRSALATFNNYKLQQAAQREVENAEKELSSQEEVLLGSLDIIEQIEKKISEIEKVRDSETQKFNKENLEYVEHVSVLEDRIASYSEEKQSLVEKVNPAYMDIYNRVHEKYVVDPVVAVENNSCTGCFVQVSPQLIVEISRANSICKCSGCGRILYIK